MRICVAHLISLLVVLLALFMNLYFLIRGHKEYASLSSTLQSHGAGATLDEQLNYFVDERILSYEHQIEELEQTLNKIKKRLDEYSERCSNQLSTQSYAVNYADEKLGATIRAVRAEPVSTPTSSLMHWSQTTNPPVNMLRSSMQAGCCFAFKNNKAEIEIKLARDVRSVNGQCYTGSKAYIESVKIEHIPKSESPTKDTSSAPRHFSVYGIEERTGDRTHLGDYEFTNEVPGQVFDLPIKRVFRIIRFSFTGNHGHPKYTCVYRVLVYGKSREK